MKTPETYLFLHFVLVRGGYSVEEILVGEMMRRQNFSFVPL